MGHIRKKSQGSYQIVAEAGRDPVTGKRRQVWETVRGSLKNAQRRLAELERSLDQGDFVQRSPMTLGQWLKKWHQTYAVTNLRARTAVSYLSEINTHLIPRLGAVPLQKLTPQHLEDYKEHALLKGRVDGKGGLSPTTVRYHLNILGKALKQAARMGYVSRNIAQVVDLPRVRRLVVKTMALDDIPRFLEAARPTFYYRLFYTALWTGMRLSELLGLRWCDVNLNLGYLSVVQAFYKHGSVCEMGEPKSKYSRRRITLPESLLEVLTDHRLEQEAQGIMLGRPLVETDLVFSHPGGKPMDPSTVSHAFTRILRQAGLPHIRFHDLRHSHASLLLQAGVHPKVVSERLGHASVAFTLDIYSHVVPGIQEAAAERFDRFISSARVDEVDISKTLKPLQNRNVAKMLPKGVSDPSKKGGFECEPHRSRTCNLLIKSQLLCQLS